MYSTVKTWQHVMMVRISDRVDYCAHAVRWDEEHHAAHNKLSKDKDTGEVEQHQHRSTATKMLDTMRLGHAWPEKGGPRQKSVLSASQQESRERLASRDRAPSDHSSIIFWCQQGRWKMGQNENSTSTDRMARARPSSHDGTQKQYYRKIIAGQWQH